MDEDLRHVQRIFAAFHWYKHDKSSLVKVKKKTFDSLSDKHKKLLLGCCRYQLKLDLFQSCLGINYSFLQSILPTLSNPQSHLSLSPSHNDDVDRVKSTLRQFVREWSKEGEQERMQIFTPILNALKSHFSPISTSSTPLSSTPNHDHYSMNNNNWSDLNILVPGAGLGRLAFDIASIGFSCQGNEFSFYMLLSSNFILNKCDHALQYRIYPWIHSFSNHLSTDDQFRGVDIPDILPSSSIHPSSNFSMVAGEFLEVYGAQSQEWDAVVTCFFLDTAHNIIDYIETIYKILKEGGIWINLGPLLYHFEDVKSENSIEVTWEELLELVKAVGFDIGHVESGIRTTYAANFKSMLTYSYSCGFFTCVKPKISS